jgi:hypothetical protein
LAQNEEPYHVLQFLPQYAELLPHFVAHEAMHAIRVYSVPKGQRRIPAILPGHVKRVGLELRDYLFRLVKRGMPEELMSFLFNTWHFGVVRQLANIPVDMRIERFLKASYSGLEVVQRKAKKLELRQSYEALKKRVEALTPPKVYHASNTMNSAYAIYLSWLFNDKRFAEPYKHTRYWKQGYKLAEQIWESEDRGHLGDVETTDEWAELFQLKEWFEWAELEQANDTDNRRLK